MDRQERNAVIMKKIPLFLFFFVTAVFIFAQAFDNFAYSNPDNMTYFQQEMTSLIRFQTENNFIVPFFISASTRSWIVEYDPEYIKSIYADYPEYNYYPQGDDNFHKLVDGVDFVKMNSEINILIGCHVKINREFYIPFFVSNGQAQTESYTDQLEFIHNDTVINEPVHIQEFKSCWYFGSGLCINTDIIKGGIYIGYIGWLSRTPYGKETMLAYPSSNGTIMIFPDDTIPIRIAFVPIVNTSNWKYVGKVLDNISAYLGMGNIVYTAEESNSVMSGFVSSINSVLGFTFNKINIDSFSINSQIIYSRGNYDSAAKTDTLGLKLNGLFSGFPLGFILEGGYKHFFSVSQFYKSDYHDMGYFNGSIYFPLKYFTLGLMYQYDNIYQHKFGVAISTYFLSGFLLLNPIPKTRMADKDLGYNAGLRYRHGGWRINKR
jgi:hypothetical protein